ncbi:hypothetical protein BKA57DRAFT_87144 [Linnemannia elongata]|nr:hypothetical protein BKA57DRAFT_163418 [Linnemannia elongata]KAH7044683.1 hypothetical protein BKA57DRAFT_87144 [Linnemannia elongata]
MMCHIAFVLDLTVTTGRFLLFSFSHSLFSLALTLTLTLVLFCSLCLHPSHLLSPPPSLTTPPHPLFRSFYRSLFFLTFSFSLSILFSSSHSLFSSLLLFLQSYFYPPVRSLSPSNSLIFF